MKEEPDIVEHSFDQLYDKSVHSERFTNVWYRETISTSDVFVCAPTSNADGK